jgi:hypothetical protein
MWRAWKWAQDYSLNAFNSGQETINMAVDQAPAPTRWPPPMPWLPR